MAMLKLFSKYASWKSLSSTDGFLHLRGHSPQASFTQSQPACLLLLHASKQAVQAILWERRGHFVLHPNCRDVTLATQHDPAASLRARGLSWGGGGQLHGMAVPLCRECLPHGRGCRGRA